MLWSVIVFLVLLWALGFGLHVGGGLIHILLVFLLIAFIFQFVPSTRFWGRGPP